jgi:subtilisin family serine protease
MTGEPSVRAPREDAGTSAAAPHVAGVAALVIGADGGQMNPDTVEAILRATADDLGKDGVDDFYSHGRVNAARGRRAMTGIRSNLQRAAALPPRCLTERSR